MRGHFSAQTMPPHICAVIFQPGKSIPHRCAVIFTESDSRIHAYYLLASYLFSYTFLLSNAFLMLFVSFSEHQQKKYDKNRRNYE